MFSHAPAAPRRALLHPLWLGSLAVLAVNDHVLKGAGVLPEFVTGKLSDVAGMLVAPLLLAAVLGTVFGARGRRTWLLAHAAVALVFAGIQVVPAIATAWSGAMAGLGFSWTITPDPTDLFTLPLLVLSAWFYPHVMRTRSVANVRRSAEVGVAGVGVLLCAATSPPPSEFTPQPQDLFTDVWLHNATESSLVVRIRALKGSVDADCDLLEVDPGRLLSDPLFGASVAWTLLPGENLSVRRGIEAQEFDAPPIERECLVALVDIDGVAPSVFFWREGDLEQQTVPSEEWQGDISGGVMIETGDDEQVRLTHDDAGIVHRVVTELPPTAGACAPQQEGGRVAWSDVPVGLHRLAGVDEGIDGCLRLDLADPASSPENESTEQWYLCVPTELFPFAAGDEISVETIDTGASSGIRVAQQQTGFAELWVYAGGLAPATKGVAFAPVPDYGCELRAEPECGTVARSSVIIAGGGKFDTAEVAAGQSPTTLEGDDGSQAIVYVAHAQERIAVDAECAEGPDTIGDDVEVAVAIIPAAQ